MKIPKAWWTEYIDILAKISDKAGEEYYNWLCDFIYDHDISEPENRKAIIDYAYSLATKYGEASAAAAAEAYDAIAAASGAKVLPAVPANTATYGETAKAIQGQMLRTHDAKVLGSVVGNLVKTAGVDTTMQNALRDGAEWAWIPSGDTCVFCKTLASRGWQTASKKAIKNGHAAHIHKNCDCTYAVRFDGSSTVEGYDPNALYEEYLNAEGETSAEKINAMRREQYAKKKDSINAQRREAYARRKEGAPLKAIRGKDVTKIYKQEATPKLGILEFEEGFNKDESSDELATAEIILKELGGNVKLNAEKDRQKNPDYEWRQSLWDLKTISSEKAANSAVRSGMKQIHENPGGVILNMNDHNLSMDELVDVIEKRMGWYKDDCADIIIISNGEIIKVLRY